MYLHVDRSIYNKEKEIEVDSLFVCLHLVCIENEYYTELHVDTYILLGFSRGWVARLKYFKNAL